MFGAVLAGLLAAAFVGGQPARAVVPGVNGLIAFSRTTDQAANREIYTMNPDGTDQVNVSRNAANDIYPAWSPDGTKIAFATARPATANYEIYVMNADGTGQVNLSRNAAFDIDPAWSPDGTKIAFTREDVNGGFGNDEIYVMNADGTGQVNLSRNPAQDDEPDWSPDGTKIAFTSQRDGPDGIYTMNPDGTGQVNISGNAALGVKDTDPAWSPAGTEIAFTSDRTPCGPGGSLVCGDGGPQVWVMNADGTAQVNLSRNDPNDNGAEEAPAWSPDGTKIAFDRLAGNVADEVYVMNADGTGQINVTRNAAMDAGPDWGPALTAPAPTSKEQCKNSGWRNFPQFKNQGQCVAFVNHNS